MTDSSYNEFRKTRAAWIGFITALAVVGFAIWAITYTVFSTNRGMMEEFVSKGVSPIAARCAISPPSQSEFGLMLMCVEAAKGQPKG